MSEGTKSTAMKMLEALRKLKEKNTGRPPLLNLGTDPSREIFQRVRSPPTSPSAISFDHVFPAESPSQLERREMMVEEVGDLPHSTSEANLLSSVSRLSQEVSKAQMVDDALETSFVKSPNLENYENDSKHSDSTIPISRPGRPAVPLFIILWMTFLTLAVCAIVGVGVVLIFGGDIRTPEARVIEGFSSVDPVSRERSSILRLASKITAAEDKSKLVQSVQFGTYNDEIWESSASIRVGYSPSPSQTKRASKPDSVETEVRNGFTSVRDVTTSSQHQGAMQLTFTDASVSIQRALVVSEGITLLPSVAGLRILSDSYFAGNMTSVGTLSAFEFVSNTSTVQQLSARNVHLSGTLSGTNAMFSGQVTSDSLSVSGKLTSGSVSTMAVDSTLLQSDSGFFRSLNVSSSLSASTVDATHVVSQQVSGATATFTNSLSVPSLSANSVNTQSVVVDNVNALGNITAPSVFVGGDLHVNRFASLNATLTKELTVTSSASVNYLSAEDLTVSGSTSLSAVSALNLTAASVDVTGYVTSAGVSTGNVTTAQLVAQTGTIVELSGSYAHISGELTASFIRSDAITTESHTATTLSAGSVTAEALNVSSAISSNTLNVRDSITSSTIVTSALSTSSLQSNTISSDMLTVSGELSAHSIASSSLSIPSLSTSGAVTSSSMSTSGDITAQHLLTETIVNTGSVSSSGPITASSITSTGAITASSLSTSGIITSASLSTIGSMTSSSLSVSGAISASSLTTNGNLTTQQLSSASVISGYISTSGILTTAAVSSAGDVTARHVVATSVTTSMLSSSGAIEGASLSTSGSITASSLSSAGAATVRSLMSTSLSASGSMTSSSMSTSALTVTTLELPSLSTAGAITAASISTVSLSSTSLLSGSLSTSGSLTSASVSAGPLTASSLITASLSASGAVTAASVSTGSLSVTTLMSQSLSTPGAVTSASVSTTSITASKLSVPAYRDGLGWINNRVAANQQVYSGSVDGTVKFANERSAGWGAVRTTIGAGSCVTSDGRYMYIARRTDFVVFRHDLYEKEVPVSVNLLSLLGLPGICTGYFSAMAFDGINLYLMPGGTNCFLVRYNVMNDFQQAASWSYTPSSTGETGGVLYAHDALIFSQLSTAGFTFIPKLDLYQTVFNPTFYSFNLRASSLFPSMPNVGWTHMLMDAEYIYLTPAAGQSFFMRFTLRQDPALPAFWARFDASAVDSSLANARYSAATFDGRFSYYGVTMSTSVCSGQSAKILRFDHTVSFTSAASYQLYTLSGLCDVGAIAFDGTFIYMAPQAHDNGRRNMARYDSRLPFSASSSWEYISYATAGSGFHSAVFDGQYLYFISSSRVDRVDTGSPYPMPSLANLARGSQLYITNDGKIGVGTTSPTYDLHVVGNIYASGSVIGAAGASGASGYASLGVQLTTQTFVCGAGASANEIGSAPCPAGKRLIAGSCHNNAADTGVGAPILSESFHWGSAWGCRYRNTAGSGAFTFTVTSICINP